MLPYRDHTEVLPRAGQLVEGLVAVEDTAVLVRVALQLMVNICVGQRSGQEAVWRVCFPHVFRYKSTNHEFPSLSHGDHLTICGSSCVGFCLMGPCRAVLLNQGTAGRHDNIVCMLLYFCTLENTCHRWAKINKQKNTMKWNKFARNFATQGSS